MGCDMASKPAREIDAKEVEELIAFMRSRANALHSIAGVMKDRNVRPQVQNTAGVERWRRAVDGLVLGLKRELDVL